MRHPCSFTGPERAGSRTRDEDEDEDETSRRGGPEIYFASDRGAITVCEASDRLNVLARADLKEPIMATPAIVDGKIYVRTDKRLHAFGR